ncbi:hypothetical protein ACIHAA_21335 [Streptomyces sp. NPDC052040]|uniref:hypothetical protein n=1 Tax=Streptomyces sp. NPDC052040 TaxID=3365682 RepID=UPI0037CD0575
MLTGTEGILRCAYLVIVSPTRACIEELRALTWDHVALKARPDFASSGRRNA